MKERGTWNETEEEVRQRCKLSLIPQGAGEHSRVVGAWLLETRNPLGYSHT